MTLSTPQRRLYVLKKMLGTTLFLEKCVTLHGMSERKKFRIDAQLYLRRSGPAAASSLCVCQSGTWRSHTARHRTARLGTARQDTSPPQPQILTRFRHLVHCQHYSPGHTASAHTPARKAENLVEHNTGVDTQHIMRDIHTLLMF